MADLVLVHGITESKRTWDPLLEPLQRHHRVLAVDLRGHGDATREPPFDLTAMATDVVTAMTSAEFNPADAVLIGHSLGGMVVSAMASIGVGRGVINVDQPLRLGDFQDGLRQLEPMLRGDDSAFRTAISMVFDAMRGPLPADEVARIEAVRQPDQQVVLGVWDPVLTSPAADLEALVNTVASTIRTPYLALHGIDPGPAYATWLMSAIPSAHYELWADHGHYPHLVDQDRFVQRVESFLAELSRS